MPSGILAKLNFGLRRSIITSTKPASFSKSYITSSRVPPRHNLVSRTPMAASGPKAVFGELYIDDMFAGSVNGVELSKPSGVFFSDRRRPRCLKASVTMVRGSSSCRELPSCPSSTAGLVCGNFGLDSIRGSHCSVVLGSRNVHVWSSARDVSVDGKYQEEQQMVDENLESGQTLKLLSGSCYLPHPDKESYGGEDAHFICTDEQAIGVADGVGGWADVGVNAGLYARELMSNSVSAIREEPRGLIDPARVLERAHAGTQAKGSSTACIIALTSQGINAINLGDSGFIVIRDGCTIFQSPVQQHGFNFTYQLESGSGGDLPSSGQVFTIPTTVGDVIVAGTDGLFDNLYNNEVTAVVVQAVRAGLEPQKTAQQIAALARERALDRSRQTPFSTAAQDAGFRYYGGKLDDITVVVSYITASSNV